MEDGEKQEELEPELFTTQQLGSNPKVRPIAQLFSSIFGYIPLRWSGGR